MVERLVKSEDEWRRVLTPEQFHVMREHGTEPACSGALWGSHADGTYLCAACGLDLFTSQAKFDSGTGWPSFLAPVSPDHLEEHEDCSHGMVRTEVRCARCNSHLGHVFTDGPPPIGLRYCMNSVALRFELRPDRQSETA